MDQKIQLSSIPQVQAEQVRQAIAQKSLELYYQPRVCLVRGEIIGAEALVRWPQADGELIYPDQFIPLAEEKGWLGQITLDMLARVIEAIERLSAHEDSRLRELSLSMNVSPTDLDQQELTRQIETCLQASRISPQSLHLEITESIAMTNFERVRADLVSLNQLGINVMMDDFGTGYSSIDRLSQLPFSALKLDKGLVQRMGDSTHGLDVVRASISMARELRMTSVAEGVENEGAYNFLVASGCAEAQGFWLSQPLPLAEFIALVEQAPNWRSSQIGQVHQALYNILHYRKSLIDAAWCLNLNAESVLPSVVLTEVRIQAEESRFGRWYYGHGQKLRALSSFRQLENPFLLLHGSGQKLMQLMASPVDTRELERRAVALDQQADQLVQILHQLERQLLSSSKTLSEN